MSDILSEVLELDALMAESLNDDEKFEPVPAGIYRGVITKADPKISRAGNPQLACVVKITAAANGSETPVAGRSINGWITKTKDPSIAKKFFLSPLCSILGLTPEEFVAKKFSLEALQLELLKTDVSIEVVEDSYTTDEGEERESSKIKSFAGVVNV